LGDRPFPGRFFLAQPKGERERADDAQKPGFLTLSRAATKYFRKKPGTLECLCLISEIVKLGIFMGFTIIFMPKST
jgi:hypothetical protein